MKTSYSALDTFRRCPLRYKVQYIDKITFFQSIEAFLGVTVHGALEYMMRPNQALPSRELVREHFLTKWERNRSYMERSESYIEEGLKMIDEFYALNYHKKSNVYAVESRFSLILGEHEIVGFIDRIDKQPDTEEYVITDYKTGRSLPDISQLQQNMQLGVYALALQAQSPLLPPERITTAIYALRDNRELMSEPTRSDLQSVQENILATIDMIESSIRTGHFPACDKTHCDMCSR